MLFSDTKGRLQGQPFQVQKLTDTQPGLLRCCAAARLHCNNPLLNGRRQTAIGGSADPHARANGPSRQCLCVPALPVFIRRNALLECSAVRWLSGGTLDVNLITTKHAKPDPKDASKSTFDLKLDFQLGLHCEQKSSRWLSDSSRCSLAQLLLLACQQPAHSSRKQLLPRFVLFASGCSVGCSLFR